ncbi:MAG TPA: hypothetical protein ENJ95_18475 [Bacteroidetes bacterium]|nr:hypothetical protein [Bacteroidota bacterium]
MKSLKLKFFFVLLGLMAIVSCKKDDPKLSELILGVWVADEFFFNSQEFTSVVDYEIEFKGDMTYKVEFLIDPPDPNSPNTQLIYTGDWSIDEANSVLTLEYDHRDDVWYGVVGWWVSNDIKEERYDMKLVNDKIGLDGIIGGNIVVINLEPKN